MVKLKLLHLLTNPSGWSAWLGLRCTVLRFVAGIWTKLSDKWATRSESPQLRLRSSRTVEEARCIKEQCAVSDARIHWVNTSTMLADSLTETGCPARAVMKPFLVKNVGDAPLIQPSSLADAGKQEVHERNFGRSGGGRSGGVRRREGPASRSGLEAKPRSVVPKCKSRF